MFSKSLKPIWKKPMFFLLILQPHIRSPCECLLSHLLLMPWPAFGVAALPLMRYFKSFWCLVCLAAALWCLRCWPNVCLPAGSLWLSICPSSLHPPPLNPPTPFSSPACSLSVLRHPFHHHHSPAPNPIIIYLNPRSEHLWINFFKCVKESPFKTA